MATVAEPSARGIAGLPALYTAGGVLANAARAVLIAAAVLGITVSTLSAVGAGPSSIYVAAGALSVAAGAGVLLISGEQMQKRAVRQAADARGAER